MPLFLIFLYVYRTGLDWMHLEVGLKWACWLYADIQFGSLRPKSVQKLPNFSPTELKPMPHAQYLNVRQRKLDTNFTQSVRFLQHESAVTDSLPEREFVHGHSNLLPNDLARRVPIEAAYFSYFRRRFYQHLNSKIIHDGSLIDVHGYFCTK